MNSIFIKDHLDFNTKYSLKVYSTNNLIIKLVFVDHSFNVSFKLLSDLLNRPLAHNAVSHRFLKDWKAGSWNTHTKKILAYTWPSYCYFLRYHITWLVTSVFPAVDNYITAEKAFVRKSSLHNEFFQRVMLFITRRFYWNSI